MGLLGKKKVTIKSFANDFFESLMYDFIIAADLKTKLNSTTYIFNHSSTINDLSHVVDTFSSLNLANQLQNLKYIFNDPQNDEPIILTLFMHDYMISMAFHLNGLSHIRIPFMESYYNVILSILHSTERMNDDSFSIWYSHFELRNDEYSAITNSLKLSEITEQERIVNSFKNIAEKYLFNIGIEKNQYFIDIFILLSSNLLTSIFDSMRIPLHSEHSFRKYVNTYSRAI